LIGGLWSSGKGVIQRIMSKIEGVLKEELEYRGDVLLACGLQGDVFSRGKPRKSDVLQLFSATLQKLQGDVRSETAVGFRVLGVGQKVW
jgi:hypothetical protein